MKTMIIYASTYGFTQDCVQMLKQNLNGETRVVNINKDTIPALDDFDTILIGGSIYMGQIQKKIKQYCISNQDTLKNKKLGFFISCSTAESCDDFVKEAFPETLLKRALEVQNFGGEMRPDKMNFFHKFITKMVTKSADKEKAPPMKPLTENIIRLANTFNTTS